MAYLDRTRKNFVRGAVLAGLSTALLVLTLNYFDVLNWLEDDAYDTRMSLSAKPNTGDPDIVILDVDNASFDVFKERFGRWPPTRLVWSETLKYLSRGKPRAVVFDIMFGGPDSDFQIRNDAKFAERMRDAGNVVIGFTINKPLAGEYKVATPDPILAKWMLLDADSIPAVPGRGTSWGTEEHPLNYPLNTPWGPLAKAAAGLGSTNVDLDDDGKIRHVPLEFAVGSHAYNSLFMRTVRLLNHQEDSTRWAAHGFRLNRDSPVVPLGTKDTQKDSLLLRWHGNRNAENCAKGDCEKGNFAYLRIPYWNILCSIQRSLCNEGVETFPPDFFRNKIVIIGASATGSYENHPTPLGDTVPGFLEITCCTTMSSGRHLHGCSRC